MSGASFLILNLLKYHVHKCCDNILRINTDYLQDIYQSCIYQRYTLFYQPPPPSTPMREEAIKTNFILGKDFKGLKGKESKKGKERQKKKKEGKEVKKSEQEREE